MSVRIQVIMDESESAGFKAQAQKEGKSLSAWLRDSGRNALKQKASGDDLKDPSALKRFFQKCRQREKGRESDWEVLKRMIADSARTGTIR